MGIRERRARKHEATRQAILAAARELLHAQGHASISIRRIANRIEYSPAAIYAFFASRERILLALAQDGFELLREQTLAAAQDDQSRRNPLGRLRTAFWTYYTFSKTHPRYFDLMFLNRSVRTDDQEVRDIVNHLAGIVLDGVRAGELPRALDPVAAIYCIGASIHGVAAARVSGHLAAGIDADRVAANALDAAIAALRGGVQLRPVVRG
ncbi:MAG: TetR/AcrR family transcriptional regulator [Vicinamibacterales bacterium]